MSFSLGKGENFGTRLAEIGADEIPQFFKGVAFLNSDAQLR